MHGAINDAFWLGTIFGALAGLCASGFCRAVFGVVDEWARAKVLVALARRRSAERRDAQGVARSAPDGNHGENLKDPTLVTIDG